MAAQAGVGPAEVVTLRIALRALGWLAALAAGLVIAALLAGWIGSSIARNPDWREPERGITILVGTNGVHTELVLPLVTGIKDWRGTFPAADLAARDQPYTHVAVSWGEREVFLNTPTWADLRPVTALSALTGSDALLHVAHYVRPVPDDDFRPLRLTAGQYAALVRRIEAAAPEPGARRYPGYFAHDVFYDAPGRYDWRNTCNQWTSDTLAAAGVRTGWWTPFAGGVMKWVPRPPGDG